MKVKEKGPPYEPKQKLKKATTKRNRSKPKSTTLPFKPSLCKQKALNTKYTIHNN
jgi:hypothetical protein